MRLTLRTLLAHMDNILGAEDAEAIGKKIEDSEYATSLLHRVRDCMRRLRLGAPGVLDEGKGLDANTVGEYLDNTLPPDDVADFERVCLESDVHLAEVASCHQVLTMVLGEPAEVDPESRLRMYALPQEAAAGATPPELPSGATSAHAGPPPLAPDATAARIRAELPGYLRRADTPRRRFWPVAAVVLAALAALVAVSLFVLGNPDRRARFLAMIGQERPAAPAVAASDSQSPVQPSETIEAHPAPATDETQPAAEPTKTPPVEPNAAALPDATAPPAEPSPIATLPSAEPAAPKLEEPPSALPAPRPVEPGPIAPDREPPAELPVEAAAQPAPLPAEPVGKFVSPEQVLLTFDAAGGTWQRVADEAPLASGKTLVALPTYHAFLTVGENIGILLVDESQIELLAPDAEGVPGIAVDHGRFLIRTADVPGARLRLKIGDLAGVVTLSEAESMVAVKAERHRPVRADPATAPAPLVVDLYAANGKFQWKADAADESVDIEAPARLKLDDAPQVASGAETLPPWTTVNTLSGLDQRASATMEGEISVSRSASLALMELANHRQREVRRLALRCLVAIDEFGPLVETLGNPTHRMVWPDYYGVDLLSDAVVRGPEAAVAVRAAMEKIHPGQGAALYEMLWRYSPENCTRADAERLAEYLDSDELAFRRLSFWNLRRITGMGLYYDPDASAAERRSPVQRWKERIGQIELTKPTGEGVARP